MAFPLERTDTPLGLGDPNDELYQGLIPVDDGVFGGTNPEVTGSSSSADPSDNQADTLAAASRKKKPRGMPKRPLSAYNLFFQQQRVEIIRDASGGNQNSKKVGFADLGRMIGKKWKALSSADRKRYYKLAEDDSERYRLEMDEYNKEKSKRLEEAEQQEIRKFEEKARVTTQRYQPPPQYYAAFLPGSHHHPHSPPRQTQHHSLSHPHTQMQSHHSIHPPPIVLADHGLVASASGDFPSNAQQQYTRYDASSISLQPRPQYDYPDHERIARANSDVGARKQTPLVDVPSSPATRMSPEGTATAPNRPRSGSVSSSGPPPPHFAHHGMPPQNLNQPMSSPSSFPVPPGMEMTLQEGGEDRTFRVQYSCYSMSREKAQQYVESLVHAGGVATTE